MKMICVSLKIGRKIRGEAEVRFVSVGEILSVDEKIIVAQELRG